MMAGELVGSLARGPVWSVPAHMETLPHALHSFMLMLLTVFLLLPPTQQHVLLSLGKLLRILHPNFHAILDPAVAESQST